MYKIFIFFKYFSIKLKYNQLNQWKTMNWINLLSLDLDILENDIYEYRNIQ